MVKVEGPCGLKRLKVNGHTPIVPDVQHINSLEKQGLIYGE